MQPTGIPPIPLRPPRDLAGARELIERTRDEAVARGLALSEPPPEPLGCCGRGCEGCVWLGWFGALARWRGRVLGIEADFQS